MPWDHDDFEKVSEIRPDLNSDDLNRMSKEFDRLHDDEQVLKILERMHEEIGLGKAVREAAVDAAKGVAKLLEPKAIAMLKSVIGL